MISCSNLTRFDVFLVANSLFHTIAAIYFLVNSLMNKNDYCKFNMFLLFFLTSLTETMNINIIFRLKKSNLYDPSIRSKYKRILFLGTIGKIINTVLSVTWWSESDINPVYCSLVTQSGLSNKLGIVYEVYCLYLWIFLVIALNIYTKRKFFLIAIGGPQNEIIRENLRNLQVNMGALQILINQIQNPQYHNFEDHNELPVIPELKEEDYVKKQGDNTECYICLSAFQQDPELKVTRTECNHVFHGDCARQWIMSGHNQCPACRNIIC